MYWFFRDILWIYLKLFHRFRVDGAQNVPRVGGCILAANHASFLDPPALGSAVSTRPVRFLARKSLWRPGIADWWMSRIIAIPIDRERGDLGALRRVLHGLKQGDCVGLFPEGTRTGTGDLAAAKGGIGFLIAKAQVPVIPVYIGGTYRAFSRHHKWIRPFRVRVRIGTPIAMGEIRALGETRESFEKIGELVMKRIAELRDSV